MERANIGWVDERVTARLDSLIEAEFPKMCRNEFCAMLMRKFIEGNKDIEPLEFDRKNKTARIGIIDAELYDRFLQTVDLQYPDLTRTHAVLNLIADFIREGGDANV